MAEGMNNLPSLAALPSNPGVAKQKRPKRRPLPCPPELRYEDGEILNVDRDNRKRGSSSSFRSSPLDIIPLDSPFPQSWEDLQRINSALLVNTSMEVVLKELYRTDEFPETPRPPKSYGKVLRSFGNVHKPQYYTHTLRKPATVVHIITSGNFWDDSDAYNWDPDMSKIRTSHAGRVAYTTGILWCNANPNWTWNSGGDDTIIRCRIDLPAGTQVIIDRSPVYGGTECEFDDEGGRSFFPDVLLLPGEFIITDVKRYRSDDYDSDHASDTIESLDSEEESGPPTAGMSDKEFAARRMLDTNNFIDVRLKVTRAMQVPERV